MASIRPKDETRVTSPSAGDTLLLDGSTTRSMVYSDLVRIPLAANTTFFVSPTGSDTLNNGLSAAAPFATIQKAVDVIRNVYDPRGFSTLIQLADGTYADPVLIDGGGPYVIQGNAAAPGNVVHAAVGNCNFKVKRASLTISGLELRNLVGGFAQLNPITPDALITWTNIRFGTTDGDHMQAEGGTIRGSGVYWIIGNFAAHAHAFDRGLIELKNFTCNLIGVPAISHYFVGVNNAKVHFVNPVFVGTATGPRFLIHFNATFGSDVALSLTGLPGDVAGVMDSSALYDFLYVGDTQGGIAYVPAVASATVGGTPATYAPGVVKYKMMSGKFCYVYGSVGVTNQGVGNSGSINIGLPFPAAAGQAACGSSYEFILTGKGGIAFVGGGAAVMNCRPADGTHYIVTGQGIGFGVLYEIA